MIKFCSFLTMNFSLSIAVMLFWTIQPFMQFVFDIFCSLLFYTFLILSVFDISSFL